MDLPELLELLHRAPTSFRTMRATLRTRTNQAITMAVMNRRIDELEATGAISSSRGSIGFGFVVGEPASPSSEPEEPDVAAPDASREARFEESMLRMWAEPP